MANDVKVPVNFTYSKTPEGRKKQLASLDAMLKNKDLNFTQKALLKKRVKQLNQMNKGQKLWDKTKNAEEEKKAAALAEQKLKNKKEKERVGEEEANKRSKRIDEYNNTMQYGKKPLNNPYAEPKPETPKTPKTPKTPNKPKTPTKPKTPKTPTKTPTKAKPKTGRSGMGNEDYQGGMSVQSKAKYAKDKKDRLAREAKDKANAAKKKTTKKTAPKKKAGESGMGMNSYQNLNFKRRK